MAKGGGGAWKVAYADFVTAMMAFFLVMWLCAQDQKTKKAVASYFTNPNIVLDGASKIPTGAGSAFQGSVTGPVPHSERIAAGTGRGTYSSKATISRITRLVNEWMQSDEKLVRHWRREAVKQRESVRRESGPEAKADAVERIASKQLAARLAQELSPAIASEAKGLHRDLLVEIVADINWPEIADDLLGD
jgi:chemotaxis protein MotB